MHYCSIKKSYAQIKADLTKAWQHLAKGQTALGMERSEAFKGRKLKAIEQIAQYMHWKKVMADMGWLRMREHGIILYFSDLLAKVELKEELVTR